MVRFILKDTMKIMDNLISVSIPLWFDSYPYIGITYYVDSNVSIPLWFDSYASKG